MIKSYVMCCQTFSFETGKLLAHLYGPSVWAISDQQIANSIRHGVHTVCDLIIAGDRSMIIDQLNFDQYKRNLIDTDLLNYYHIYCYTTKIRTTRNLLRSTAHGHFWSTWYVQMRWPVGSKRSCSQHQT